MPLSVSSVCFMVNVGTHMGWFLVRHKARRIRLILDAEHDGSEGTACVRFIRIREYVVCDGRGGGTRRKLLQTEMPDSTCNYY